MKINKKIIFCLFLSIISGSNIISSQQHSTDMKNPEYLPITEYQSSLSKMITKMMSLFSYKKADSIRKIPGISVAKKETKKLTRLEAIEKIRHITTKLFDDTDVNHITFYLSRMKELTKYLDQIEDKKLITAINFLLDNHHRSSITDTLFWMRAVKELELDTIIPMTPETASKHKNEKMKTLNKKMRVGN